MRYSTLSFSSSAMGSSRTDTEYHEDTRPWRIKNCFRRRCKQRTRAVFRVASLLILISGAILANSLWDSSHHENYAHLSTEGHHRITRMLSGNVTDLGSNQGDCGDRDAPRVDSNFLLVPYVAGVLYMFIAIAIVCDEFFVPALEEIASERYMNLSMDVAGATLMAAGGSAPELFTSVIGTFQRSEVGFGTIVGSAVFNVLFVIGMCAIFSREVLHLTQWPLARDCAYYSMGLLLLAVFCGYTSPGEIVLWEAIVQFFLYIGYVILMKNNGRIYQWIQRKSSNAKVGMDLPDQESPEKAIVGKSRKNTFRINLLKRIMGKCSILDKVGISMVSYMDGDVGTVFKKIDESGDGFIDVSELHHLTSQLNLTCTDEEIYSSLHEIDTNKDGKIDLVEFTKWYIRSEARLRAELRATFDRFDVNKSGTIDVNELRELLAVLNAAIGDEEIQEIFKDTYESGATDQISYTEFEHWYIKSDHWNEKKSKADAEAEEVCEPVSDHLKPPRGGGLVAYLQWIILLPIVFILCMTVPDVRQPKKSGLCFFAFLLSIAWIGGFTYFMVLWTEIIGNTLGIPMILMGLTILAAGTSVPDLLTSVIVARMGEGDMAVSSSIGSNIFDITVGLPVPWILFCLINGESILIRTKGMEISIIILLFMLLCIVSIIHCNGWKMTKGLGLSMFFLYFIYLAQAVARELPFAPC